MSEARRPASTPLFAISSAKALPSVPHTTAFPTLCSHTPSVAMLSSSISSRLQQLSDHRHQQQQAKTRWAGSDSMTHGRQTSSAAHVPARKGLAADLINKFNQMSASPDSEPAAAVLPRTQRTSTNISTSISTSTSTWGRRSLTPRSAASSMLSEPPNRAKTSPQSATERAACAKKDTETAAVLSSPDRRSWSQQQLPSSLSQSHAAIIEPRVDSLVSGDSNTAVSTAEQHQVLARPSPFLTDSEMGRALLEIKEFSQEMNLGLLDDGDEL